MSFWQGPLPKFIPPESARIRRNDRIPAGITGASLRPQKYLLLSIRWCSPEWIKAATQYVFAWGRHRYSVAYHPVSCISITADLTGTFHRKQSLLG
jgi:hypothetical protein